VVVLQKVKFYRKMWLKKGLLHDVFSVYLLDSCMSEWWFFDICVFTIECCWTESVR